MPDSNYILPAQQTRGKNWMLKLASMATAVEVGADEDKTIKRNPMIKIPQQATQNTLVAEATTEKTTANTMNLLKIRLTGANRTMLPDNLNHLQANNLRNIKLMH